MSTCTKSKGSREGAVAQVGREGLAPEQVEKRVAPLECREEAAVTRFYINRIHRPQKLNVIIQLEKFTTTRFYINRIQIVNNFHQHVLSSKYGKERDKMKLLISILSNAQQNHYLSLRATSNAW